MNEGVVDHSNGYSGQEKPRYIFENMEYSTSFTRGNYAVSRSDRLKNYRFSEDSSDIRFSSSKKKKRTCMVLGIILLSLGIIAVIVLAVYFGTRSESEPVTTKTTVTKPPAVTTASLPTIAFIKSTARITNQNWTDSLGNSSSMEFKNLSAAFQKNLDDVFMNSSLGPNYNRSVVTGFKPGSISVNYIILLNNYKATKIESESTVRKILTSTFEQPQDSASEQFQVDVASLKFQAIFVTTTTEATTTTTSSSTIGMTPVANGTETTTTTTSSTIGMTPVANGTKTTTTTTSSTIGMTPVANGTKTTTTSSSSTIGMTAVANGTETTTMTITNASVAGMMTTIHTDTTGAPKQVGNKTTVKMCNGASSLYTFPRYHCDASLTKFMKMSGFNRCKPYRDWLMCISYFMHRQKENCSWAEIINTTETSHTFHKIHGNFNSRSCNVTLEMQLVVPINESMKLTPCQDPTIINYISKYNCITFLELTEGLGGAEGQCWYLMWTAQCVQMKLASLNYSCQLPHILNVFETHSKDLMPNSIMNISKCQAENPLQGACSNVTAFGNIMHNSQAMECYNILNAIYRESVKLTKTEKCRILRESARCFQRSMNCDFKASFFQIQLLVPRWNTTCSSDPLLNDTNPDLCEDTKMLLIHVVSKCNILRHRPINLCYALRSFIDCGSTVSKCTRDHVKTAVIAERDWLLQHFPAYDSALCNATTLGQTTQPPDIDGVTTGQFCRRMDQIPDRIWDSCSYFWSIANLSLLQTTSHQCWVYHQMLICIQEKMLLLNKQCSMMDLYNITSSLTFKSGIKPFFCMGIIGEMRPIEFCNDFISLYLISKKECPSLTSQNQPFCSVIQSVGQCVGRKLQEIGYVSCWVDQILRTLYQTSHFNKNESHLNMTNCKVPLQQFNIPYPSMGKEKCKSMMQAVLLWGQCLPYLVKMIGNIPGNRTFVCRSNFYLTSQCIHVAMRQLHRKCMSSYVTENLKLLTAQKLGLKKLEIIRCRGSPSVVPPADDFCVNEASLVSAGNKYCGDALLVFKSKNDVKYCRNYHDWLGCVSYVSHAFKYNCSWLTLIRTIENADLFNTTVGYFDPTPCHKKGYLTSLKTILPINESTLISPCENPNSMYYFKTYSCKKILLSTKVIGNEGLCSYLMWIVSCVISSLKYYNYQCERSEVVQTFEKYQADLLTDGQVNITKCWYEWTERSKDECSFFENISRNLLPTSPAVMCHHLAFSNIGHFELVNSDKCSLIRQTAKCLYDALTQHQNCSLEPYFYYVLLNIEKSVSIPSCSIVPLKNGKYPSFCADTRAMVLYMVRQSSGYFDSVPISPCYSLQRFVHSNTNTLVNNLCTTEDVLRAVYAESDWLMSYFPGYNVPSCNATLGKSFMRPDWFNLPKDDHCLSKDGIPANIWTDCSYFLKTLMPSSGRMQHCQMYLEMLACIQNRLMWHNKTCNMHSLLNSTFNETMGATDGFNFSTCADVAAEITPTDICSDPASLLHFGSKDCPMSKSVLQALSNDEKCSAFHNFTICVAKKLHEIGYKFCKLDIIVYQLQSKGQQMMVKQAGIDPRNCKIAKKYPAPYQHLGPSKCQALTERMINWKMCEVYLRRWMEQIPNDTAVCRYFQRSFRCLKIHIQRLEGNCSDRDIWNQLMINRNPKELFRTCILYGMESESSSNYSSLPPVLSGDDQCKSLSNIPAQDLGDCSLFTAVAIYTASRYAYCRLYFESLVCVQEKIVRKSQFCILKKLHEEFQEQAGQLNSSNIKVLRNTSDCFSVVAESTPHDVCTEVDLIFALGKVHCSEELHQLSAVSSTNRCSIFFNFTSCITDQLRAIGYNYCHNLIIASILGMKGRHLFQHHFDPHICVDGMSIPQRSLAKLSKSNCKKSVQTIVVLQTCQPFIDAQREYFNTKDTCRYLSSFGECISLALNRLNFSCSLEYILDAVISSSNTTWKTKCGIGSVTVPPKINSSMQRSIYLPSLSSDDHCHSAANIHPEYLNKCQMYLSLMENIKNPGEAQCRLYYFSLVCVQIFMMKNNSLCTLPSLHATVQASKSSLFNSTYLVNTSTCLAEMAEKKFEYVCEDADILQAVARRGCWMYLKELGNSSLSAGEKCSLLAILEKCIKNKFKMANTFCVSKIIDIVLAAKKNDSFLNISTSSMKQCYGLMPKLRFLPDSDCKILTGFLIKGEMCEMYFEQNFTVNNTANCSNIQSGLSCIKNIAIQVGLYCRAHIVAAEVYHHLKSRNNKIHPNCTESFQEAMAPKPGLCPVSPTNGVSTCEVLCQFDLECPGNEKCCKYLCKVSCMKPTNGTHS